MHWTQARRLGTLPPTNPMAIAFGRRGRWGTAAPGLRRAARLMATGNMCETPWERLDTTPRDPCARSCSVAHALAIARCRPVGEESSSPPSCQQENTTYVNTNAKICQGRSFCGRRSAGDRPLACPSRP
jgi:hypothetical protein